MRDVFPEEARKMQQLETRARTLFSRYGLGEIRTPLVEHTLLFERGVGQGTDIVNKEMFYVPAKEQEVDESGNLNRKMVLRPEATASVVRAYIEHEVYKARPGVQRYFYVGPMFRYERPQRGRYRQFTQIGIEVLGAAQPALDTEVIILLHDLLSEFGLLSFAFQLNAVGCPTCRPDYIQKLKAYMQSFHAQLCLDCQSRIEKNPLRLFDCKQAACREVMANAPSIQNFLCAECRTHQSDVFRLLEKSGIAYQVDSRLMRGLDYYTRTVFEVVSEDLGAQNAVAAGGRYDNLVAELDGPVTPAIGWSIGVERLLELLPASTWKKPELDVFVVASGPDFEQTFLHVIEMRRQGVRIGMEYEGRSVKVLLKRADRLGARFALFVSADDSEKIEIKNMATGEQFSTEWKKLPALMRTSQ